MPHIQDKNCQALDCIALSQVIDEVKRVFQNPEHHIQKSTLRFRVARQAIRQCSTRAASHAGRHDCLNSKKILVGCRQSYEVVAHQKAQDLPAAIAACPADHQHAAQYIEYIVGRRSGINEYLAGFQIPRWGSVKNVKKDVMRFGTASHLARMDGKRVTRNPRFR